MQESFIISMEPRITFILLSFSLLPLSLLATDSPDITSDKGNVAVVTDKGSLMISSQTYPVDPVRALSEGHKTLAVAEAIGNVEKELQALRTIANAQWHMGMSMDFLRTTLRSLKTATMLGDPRQIAAVLMDLSTAYRSNMRFEMAVEEARKAVAVLVPLQDPQSMAEAQRFLVSTLVFAGEHTDALTMISQLRSTCGLLDDELCLARTHHLTAAVLIDQRKFADALPFITKAERILLDRADIQDRFQLAVDRTTAMLGLEMAEKAITSLKQAESLSARLKGPHDVQTLLRLKYDLALLIKDHKQALGHLQELKALSDSLESVRSDINMAGLQVMHQLESKEQDNAQLRDVNAQQEVTISDQRFHNRALLSILSVMVALAVALFIISRHALRTMKRLKRKNEVIRRQHDEIERKVLELKRQNMRLAECIISEEEKEVILKEIHHRVKNNLQVVDSMLNMQVNDMNDPRVQRMLKDAQGRIRSMAMVHEHIYRTNGDRNADLRAHFEKLGRNVLVAHGVHDRISMSVASSLPTFPIETLLPLSLMVNELITNSIKHAFNGTDGGNIKVIINSTDQGYELRYIDDGVGIEHVGGETGKGSFGHELIGILAHQLNGEVRLIRESGCVFSMTFTPDKELLKAAS